VKIDEIKSLPMGKDWLADGIINHRDDGLHRTPLFVAASKGHVDVVSVLLTVARVNVNAKVVRRWPLQRRKRSKACCDHGGGGNVG